MKISINWLQDFVDLSGISTDEIVKRFNLSTAEIEEVEHKGENIEGVITARIDKILKHPNSEKLQIMQLNIGKDEPVQVLTTAKNIYEGMVTAFCTVGGKVCGQKIGKAVMGGEPSYGMGVSELDLGLGSDDSGLIDIKENVPLGVDVKEIWPIEDTVFEIDNKTLSNRPDLWGHVGIAREMAAIFGRKFSLPKTLDTKKYSKLPKISIDIETENCYRYSAIKLGNVTRKISPYIMKLRLGYAGMRDINFIADLTNYVMLEMGQPLHAFDASKVSGICVCEAKKGTKMLTLEGEEHTLPEGAITICDEKRTPVAVAGIKGGLLSGIADETTGFLLESAVFEASAIRKTSRAIGLSTDASIRYEKSLDPRGTTFSIERVLELLTEFDPAAKVESCLSDNTRFLYPEIKIDFSGDFVRRRIGANISDEKMVEILKSLEFVVEDKGNGDYSVVVPSFRATKDVSIREDLVEEIARMYGYDNIVAAPLAGDLAPVVQSKEHLAEYRAKRLLAEKFGAREVHTYIWKYKEFCEKYGIDMPVFVSLLDASNSGQSGIRSMMTPSLLKVYEENKNSTMPLKIFEIGRVANGIKESGRTNEEKHLAILFAAPKSEEEQTFKDILAAVKNVAESEALTNVSFAKAENLPNIYSTINSCAIVGQSKQVLGYVGLLNEKMSRNLDKRFCVAVAELNFAALVREQPIKKNKLQLSKYQSTKIDFNFLVDKNSTYGEFEKILNQFKPKLVAEFSLVDVFESDALGDKKSYTIRAEICATDRTLSAEDIERFRTKLIEHMERNNITMKA